MKHQLLNIEDLVFNGTVKAPSCNKCCDACKGCKLKYIKSLQAIS